MERGPLKKVFLLEEIKWQKFGKGGSPYEMGDLNGFSVKDYIGSLMY